MKIARHAQIIKLINQYDIETQEELAKKLGVDEEAFLRHLTLSVYSRFPYFEGYPPAEAHKSTKRERRKPLCGSAERTVRGWEPLCARVKRRVYFR